MLTSNKPTMSNQQIIDTPENWDLASKGYSEKVAPLMMEVFAEDFVDRLTINNHTNAIEVACGSGAITSTLSKSVDSLLAVDFSPAMLDLAKSRIEAEGSDNVSFALMDGQALEVEDETMERAMCCFGLMLFPDRHKGFKELHRVLKPGGKAVVSGWAGPDKFEAFGLFTGAIQKAFPDIPKPDSPPPVFTLADLDSFKSQMEAGGFTYVSVEYIEKELTLNDFDELWGMLTVGAPPVKMLFNKLGSERKSSVHDALTEIVQERFGNGPISMVNNATVGVGSVE